MSEEKEQDRRVMKASEVMGPPADTAFEMRSGGTRTQWTGSSPTTAGSGLATTGATGPALKYYFSLRSDLAPVSNRGSVGFEVPEGTRLHVNYDSKDDQVSTEPTLYQGSWGQAYNSNWAKGIDEKAVPYGPEDWYGIGGKIRSGGDWILIQKDGVARFDARVTIESRDNVLIDAVFTGAVDLRAAVSGLTVTSVQDVRDLGKNVYDAYLKKDPAYPQLPVALSVRFEASEQPYLRPGEDGSWVAKSRYARQRKNFWRYQKLVRSLFVGRGTVRLGNDKHWPPEAIGLDIYALE